MENTMKYVLIMISLGLLLICCGGETDPESRTFTNPPLSDANAWEVESTDYEYFMTFVAEIQLDGEPVCGLDNILAAFSDTQIRGVAQAYEHAGCVVYNLIIYSNNLGENISLGVYLSDEDQTVACTNEITFQAGTGLGNPDEPYLIEVL